uniref:Uncharacterized protein n=1 Tax=viral metagenome TaxID=1070528 RepID=A0A6H1ZYW3_9ZZZZ
MSLIDEDRDRLRGIYEGNWYVGKPLFTKYIKLTDLPRWKPKKIIGLRPFEEDEE